MIPLNGSLFLPLVVIGHLFFILSLTPYLTGGDGLHYAELANDLVTGTFALSPEPFSNRFGVILPVAGLYDLFGVTPWTTISWPVFCSLLTIPLLYAAVLETADRRHAQVAVILLAFNPFQVGLALYLSADMVMTPFVLLALILLFRRGLTEKNAARYGGFAALSLFVAMLVKLTIVALLPLLLWLFVKDGVNKKNRAFWLGFVGVGLILLVLFFFAYTVVTGNPLYRFSGVTLTDAGHDYSSYADTGRSLHYRLTTGLFLSLLDSPGLSIAMVLALPALLVLGFEGREGEINRWKFWIAAGACLFLFYWFGSASLSHYVPLPPHNRMLLPLFPVLAMLGAWTVLKFLDGTLLKEKGERESALERLLVFAVPVGLFMLTWLLWKLHYYKRDAALAGVILTVPFVWYFWGDRIRKKSRWMAYQAPLLLVLVLWLSIAVLNTRSGGLIYPPVFSQLKQITWENLSLREKKTILYTDRRSARLIRFYLNFNDRHEVVPVPWHNQEIPRCGEDKEILVLVNPHLIHYTTHHFKEPPPAWVNFSPGRGVMVTTSRLTLYDFCGERG